ncbi:hypothetical protein GGI01_003595 [Coemansia sp. RSA 376]|nr:hypothetical protein H4S03_006533 [Coemansia sp. S3946]KAJ2048008.1 hypothetical protein H4S04_004089 [Coemansia sp. S16]KAJ2073044.1 hypothetical protein GGH13_002274 [Coemansia sp. S155-1]KAJ2111499.1 hypothetical protein IW146_005310 [Coemansia sp. RSA 922]KAJ2259519.1 hypothetical protein GGI01_003595 [Coemansia sp. RSA 376]KAJ2465854.1 hypothetical protein GGI03_002426 [Coemansia sp. RSA 2337]
MPSYIYRYFNSIGFGEVTRLLLTAAKVEWTEEFSEFGQGPLGHPDDYLPVLIQKNSDGRPDVVFNEVISMERYLARTYGLLPANPEQVELQEQLREKQAHVMVAFAIGMSAPGIIRELLLIDFEKELEKLISTYTELLRRNGNTGYSYGSTLSYADMVIYSFLKLVPIHFAMFSKALPKLVKGKMTPELAKLAATVEADPLLAAYLSQRG